MSEKIWGLPVRLDDIPEPGRRFELSPDAAARSALARLVGVNDVPRLHADLDVRRVGDGLRVIGRVTGAVGQTCVVSLDPLENEVEEAIDLLFSPAGALPTAAADVAELSDASEPLVDGMIDLGAIATEFFLLGIDPYPRKPGAVFAEQHGGESSAATSPFAVLAALKKGTDGL